MRRTNVYLEDIQMSEIARLADSAGVPAAEMMRRLLDLAMSIQDPLLMAGDIAYVRQRMIEKKGGDDVSYPEMYEELAREKAIEYRDRKNNSARITTLVEDVTELKTEVVELKKEVIALRLQNAQLTEAVLGLNGGGS